MIFATWGIVYHYAVWIQKPPTRRFFQRTFELLARERVPRSARILLPTLATHIFAQRFIGRRSGLRWWMHQCLFWGWQGLCPACKRISLATAQIENQRRPSTWLNLGYVSTNSWRSTART